MNQIARARQLAGLTARELAALAGTSHSTLIAYEQGHKVPRSDTRDRILRAAGWVVDAPGPHRPRRRVVTDFGQRVSVELQDLLSVVEVLPSRPKPTLDAPVFPERVGP